MDDFDARENTLRRAIATLRTQLSLVPHDDARRTALYRDLLWCYQEAFALLYARIAARRAEQRRQHERLRDGDR